MQNIENIYEEYFETVYKYLFCLTHNKQISEDLTQETFFRAVTNINTFRNECKISVWLCQIAKNLWYNELKKDKKIEHINNEDISIIPSNEDVENKIVSNFNKLELYKRLQRLDKQTREVIYLRITGELSFKEIADILNKTENWARVTFYRGKLKLKEGNCNER